MTPKNLLNYILNNTDMSKRKLSMLMGYKTTSNLYTILNSKDGTGITVMTLFRLLDHLGYDLIARERMSDYEGLEYKIDDNNMDWTALNEPEEDKSWMDDLELLSEMGIRVVDE